jgi:beta-xylosidase
VTEPFPESDPERKTITYSAENVHDFAWFADKRFKVLHDTLQLAGRSEAVDVWSFFTETEAAYWMNSTAYLKRATRFYSDRVGTYPYPQVTGVQFGAQRRGRDGIPDDHGNWVDRE